MKKLSILIVAILTILPIFSQTTEETIYLNSGGSSLWSADDAKFVVWYWCYKEDGDGVDGQASDFMTIVPGDENVYKTTLNIREDLTLSEYTVIFLRVSSSTTDFDVDYWDDLVWNRTTELWLIDAGEYNYFEITSWYGDEYWGLGGEEYEYNFTDGFWSSSYSEPTSVVAVYNYPTEIFLGETIDFLNDMDIITSYDFNNPTITYEVLLPEATEYTAINTTSYTPNVAGDYTFRITATEEANVAACEFYVGVVNMTIELYAYSSWSPTYVYIWGSGNSDIDYKFFSMTSLGDNWYSYEYTGVYGDIINAIFLDSYSWDTKSTQTGDILGITESTSYVIDGTTATAINSSAMTSLTLNYYSEDELNYLYIWQVNDQSSVYNLSGSWPGQMCELDADNLWRNVEFTYKFAADNYTSALNVILNNYSGTQTDPIYLLSSLYSDGSWISDDMEVWIYSASTSNNTVTLRTDLKNLLENQYYLYSYNSGENIILNDYGVTYSDDSYSAYKAAYDAASVTFGAYASTQTEIDDAETALTNAYNSLKKVLTVDADVTLSVADDDDIIVNELYLNSYINNVPKIDFSAASIYAMDALTITKTVDDAIYYYFSLPFDCAVSDIVAVDAAGNSLVSSDYENVWVVREYSEYERATNWRSVASGTSVGWQYVGYDATLKANQGYFIGFGYGGTDYSDRSEVASCSFTFISDAALTLKNLTDVAVTATDVELDDEANRAAAQLHKGYNLISVPSYAVYCNSISYTSSDNSDNDIQYVSVSYPNADGYGYTQFSTVEGDFDFEPFLPFFVQVPENGTVDFDYDFMAAQTASGAPMLSPSAVGGSSEDYIVVNLLQNDEVVDKTTAIFVEKDVTNYTVGYDLEKMFSSAIPQIYILDKGYDLAVNARQSKESDIITLEIYIPSAGEYTLSLSSNDYMIEDVNSGNLSETVTFTKDAAGYITGEYRVVRQLITTDNNSVGSEVSDLSIYTQKGAIVVENLNTSSPIYLYTASGQLVNIYTSSHSNITINGLNSGIYLLRVENETYKLIINN